MMSESVKIPPLKHRAVVSKVPRLLVIISKLLLVHEEFGQLFLSLKPRSWGSKLPTYRSRCCRPAQSPTAALAACLVVALQQTERRVTAAGHLRSLSWASRCALPPRH